MLTVTIVLQYNLSGAGELVKIAGTVFVLFYCASLYGTNFNLAILGLLAGGYGLHKLADKYNDSVGTTMMRTGKLMNHSAMLALYGGCAYKVAQKYGLTGKLNIMGMTI